MKKYLVMVLCLAMVFGVATAAAAIDVISTGTATNWNLEFVDKIITVVDGEEVEVDAQMRINLQTTETGSNIKFHLSLYVDGEQTITTSVPGIDFGSGTFLSYVTIGGYTVRVPLQGNDFGKGGNPTLESITGCNLVLVGRQAPTCLVDGYESFECKSHGHRYTNVLSALGHDLDDGVITKDPTCTLPGEKTFTCQRVDCSYTEIEAINALGHKPGDKVVTLEPTCTVKGAWEIRCTVCDEVLESGEIDERGHDWGAWVVITPAELGKDGLQRRECQRDDCDAFEEEIIPALIIKGATVTTFGKNLQDKNNQNLTFTVVITLSDGSQLTVNHAEKVNGQQKGSTTFIYNGYKVYVAWNDNNTVTTCEVRL